MAKQFIHMQLALFACTSIDFHRLSQQCSTQVVTALRLLNSILEYLLYVNEFRISLYVYRTKAPQV